MRFRPLNEQVVLITGASSGIGRQSAMRFARAGSKVILVSRNMEALEKLAEQIRMTGGEAIAAAADVADVDQLKAAADRGYARFGRIDTWVNNAGVGMYTKLLNTDLADDRRLFDTNFWGIVNGSRLAVPYLLKAGGGALINLGSEVSDLAIPVQGMYSASKHAIMGFTDSLREEIIHDGLPVSVTLIKPAGINTPFTRHAKNNFEREPTLPPPVYDVDIVADQILYAAEHGNRELYAGGGGLLMAQLGKHFPLLMDYLMASLGFKQQFADRPANHGYEGLHTSRGFHRAEGEAGRDRHIRRHSLYGITRRHPVVTALLAAVGTATIGMLVMPRQKPRRAGLSSALEDIGAGWQARR